MPKLISQKNNHNETTIFKTVSTTNEIVLDTFSKNQYQSAKYSIQIENNNNFQTTEILVVHDGVSTYNVEYGTIMTSSSLSTFVTDLLGTNIRLLATPTNQSETKYIFNRKAINS